MSRSIKDNSKQERVDEVRTRNDVIGVMLYDNCCTP